MANKEIRIPKGKKSCNNCDATGLYWHESRAGNWVLFELINIVDEAGDSVDSVHRAHYAYCGADVEQKAQKPATPEISTETREAVHTAIRIVAEACDGAMRQDGQGFSKHDARFGNSLARAGSLSNNMAAAGKKMIKKYRRQLDAAGFDVDLLN